MIDEIRIPHNAVIVKEMICIGEVEYPGDNKINYSMFDGP